MNELEKLRLLLPHWIEHNAEHAAEFRAWAERARAAGNAHLATSIESAAAKMIAANEELIAAVSLLGESS